MNKLSKTIFLVGSVFLLYGYLSRILKVYFFWESMYLGWEIILIGLISFWIGRIRIRKANGQKTIWQKIGIGFISFILLIQAIIVFIVPQTAAYDAAVIHLKNNTELKEEIGNIHGFSIVPLGSYSSQTTNGVQSGNAQIRLITKGSKKYKVIVIYIEKTAFSEWTVTATE